MKLLKSNCKAADGDWSPTKMEAEEDSSARIARPHNDLGLHDEKSSSQSQKNDKI